MESVQYNYLVAVCTALYNGHELTVVCAQDYPNARGLVFKSNCHTSDTLISSDCWSRGQQRAYKDCTEFHCWNTSVRRAVQMHFQNTMEHSEGHHHGENGAPQWIGRPKTGRPSKFGKRTREKLISKAAKRSMAALKVAAGIFVKYWSLPANGSSLFYSSCDGDMG